MFLWLNICLLGYGCYETSGTNTNPSESTETVDPQLAKLQGRWRSDLQGIQMGSGAFYNKEIEVKNDQYKETTNVYYTVNNPDNIAAAILLASLIECSVIKVNPTPRADGIIEREETVLSTVLKISDITKNEPQKILAGNETPEGTVNNFLGLLDFMPGLKLKNIVFDSNNQLDLSLQRKGTTQKLGHEFLTESSFANYFINLDDSTNLDGLGSKLIKQ